jgi:UDP-2,3-diacylglucosamine pyrophosphatase LpxH
MSRSSRSRKDSTELRARKNAGLRAFAKKLIKSGRADYVIMGHSHHPELIPFETGYYANSGDWISHHTYVEIISGKIEIKHYNIKKGETA